MTNKYYYLNRPPGPGCQPGGFTDQQAWLPKHFPAEFPRGAFGWAEYPEPLPLEAIWRYDLFPQDILERTIFIAWQDVDKDIPATRAYLEQYWDRDDKALAEIASDDFTAADVLACKEAEYTWPQVEALLGQPVAA